MARFALRNRSTPCLDTPHPLPFYTACLIPSNSASPAGGSQHTVTCDPLIRRHESTEASLNEFKERSIFVDPMTIWNEASITFVPGLMNQFSQGAVPPRSGKWMLSSRRSSSFVFNVYGNFHYLSCTRNIPHLTWAIEKHSKINWCMAPPLRYFLSVQARNELPLD